MTSASATQRMFLKNLGILSSGAWGLRAVRGEMSSVRNVAKTDHCICAKEAFSVSIRLVQLSSRVVSLAGSPHCPVEIM